MKRIIKSLRHINRRLYSALLVLGLCPAIYTTLRTFFLGQLPGEWSYSIAGQLSWVNLIYEIVNEAIILPGITIGKYAVIGAGSVVTKDIPAWCVAAGNPCRVIRKITEADRETYYRHVPVDQDALEHMRRMWA